MRLSLLEYALAAVAALLLIGFGVQSWRASHYASKVETLAAEAKLWQEANRTNLATIATLQAANKTWADKCQLQPGAQDGALAALQAANKRLADELRRARGQREVIYARDPNARAWRDAGMPAALADQLRQSAGQNADH